MDETRLAGVRASCRRRGRGYRPARESGQRSAHSHVARRRRPCDGVPPGSDRRLPHPFDLGELPALHPQGDAGSRSRRGWRPAGPAPGNPGLQHRSGDRRFGCRQASTTPGRVRAPRVLPDAGPAVLPPRPRSPPALGRRRDPHHGLDRARRVDPGELHAARSAFHRPGPEHRWRGRRGIRPKRLRVASASDARTRRETGRGGETSAPPRAGGRRAGRSLARRAGVPRKPLGAPMRTCRRRR